MKSVLFVVAQEGFRDEEFFEPKAILEKRFHCKVASIAKGECKGKLGGTTVADYSLQEAAKLIKMFEAVIFVGGKGALVLVEKKEAHNLARLAVENKKLTCAICVAPVLLSAAGVLEDKQATVFPDESGMNHKHLTDHGAVVLDGPVIVDGKIVTANGPAAATEFGQTILQMLERR